MGCCLVCASCAAALARADGLERDVAAGDAAVMQLEEMFHRAEKAEAERAKAFQEGFSEGTAAAKRQLLWYSDNMKDEAVAQFAYLAACDMDAMQPTPTKEDE